MTLGSPGSARLTAPLGYRFKNVSIKEENLLQLGTNSMLGSGLGHHLDFLPEPSQCIKRSVENQVSSELSESVASDPRAQIQPCTARLQLSSPSLVVSGPPASPTNHNLQHQRHRWEVAFVTAQGTGRPRFRAAAWKPMQGPTALTLAPRSH